MEDEMNELCTEAVRIKGTLINSCISRIFEINYFRLTISSFIYFLYICLFCWRLATLLV
jgi:hypothetical protein